ncbi:FecR family protein [Pseudoflavitalea sp. G-6-1-2]|uniref:FecR family protein n=1 Tax=Pseudoflavitalea sp. G-6-1-2 TaxID=2728841 RepID=UPI00146A2548|nr:FecR family protein [Pseudoflavitalea sp. G-6-1-2]NML23754.1 FecR family protein [Pseudoflavitalea sp. G-6-1-2]
MPDTVKKIAGLILKYWRQELEEEEQDELIDWANRSAANKQTFNRLTDPDFLVMHLRELSAIKQEIRDRIWADLDIVQTEEVSELPSGNSPARLIPWKRLAVAAIIITAAALLVFRFIRSGSSEPADVLLVETTEAISHADSLQGDYAKGNVRFGDGSFVNLDTMQNGSVLTKSGLRLEKHASLIQFTRSGSENKSDSNQISTISTPRGGNYTVQLPDGSRVSLNAVSSLSFPANFGNNARVVTVTGETGFKVKKLTVGGKNIPFIVKTSRMNMEVLGTEFNVNVYPKEKLARATLIEGSLRVWKQLPDEAGKPTANARLDVILQPGQQAQVSNNDEGAATGGIRVEKVNTGDAISWKNGVYIFSDVDCETLTRELQRWYDVKFVYPEGKPTITFSGRFSRNTPLETILERIGASTNVKFDLQQYNTVFVTPGK